MKKLFYSGLAFTCIVCLCISVNNIGKAKQFANDFVGQTEALAANEFDDKEYIGAVSWDCELTLTVDYEGQACLRGHCMSVSDELEIGSKYTITIKNGDVICERIHSDIEDHDYDCERQNCFSSWVGED